MFFYRFRRGGADEDVQNGADEDAFVGAADRSGVVIEDRADGSEGEADVASGETTKPVKIVMDDGKNDPSPVAAPEAARAAMMDFLAPSGQEVAGWFESVRGSSFVRTNAAYKARVETIRFRYEEADGRVEVFSSRLDRAAGNPRAGLVVPGGFVRLARVIGAVMASDAHAGAHAAPRLELLAGKIARTAHSFSEKAAAEMLSECGIAPEWFLDEAFVQEARDLSEGVGMAAIGHETGHVAHGHLWRPVGMDPDAFRDREDAADAFFLAVCEGEKAAAARRMFAGHVCFALVRAVRDEMDVAAIARKRGVGPDGLASIRDGLMLERRHPYAGGRLTGLLAARGDLAGRCGFDAQKISAILREAGAR